MSSCPEPIKNFREKFPKLNDIMRRLAMFDNLHEGTFSEKEASETLDRWVEYVVKDDSKETYDKIETELLMIKRGIQGKEVIQNLEEKKPKGWEKGKVWDYLNCIETGKTMSANKKGGRRSTKKKKRKRRKRNLKKRTRRRRRKSKRRRRR